MYAILSKIKPNKSDHLSKTIYKNDTLDQSKGNFTVNNAFEAF